MKRIFISRDLGSDSIFHDICHNYEIISHSLIHFEAISFTPPEANCYFFYSRNGVKYSQDSIPSGFFSSENRPLIACMGYGTAESFERTFDLKPDFIGSGRPIQVKNQLEDFLSSEQSIAFFTAEDSLHSVGNKLSDEYQQTQIKVYRNHLKENITIPDCYFYVITSPKNARALWSIVGDISSGIVISIGLTTAKSLHQLGIKEVVISPEPSEKGMLKMLEILDI